MTNSQRLLLINDKWQPIQSSILTYVEPYKLRYPKIFNGEAKSITSLDAFWGFLPSDFRYVPTVDSYSINQWENDYDHRPPQWHGTFAPDLNEDVSDYLCFNYQPIADDGTILPPGSTGHPGNCHYPDCFVDTDNPYSGNTIAGNFYTGKSPIKWSKYATAGWLGWQSRIHLVHQLTSHLSANTPVPIPLPPRPHPNIEHTESSC
nr:MAG: hypothetical protein [Hangzhou sepedon violaceus nodavirus 1]